jgi:hypothetical protein
MSTAELVSQDVMVPISRVSLDHQEASLAWKARALV